MSLNWNLQKGGGFKPKKTSMGGVWIFSGTTQWRCKNNGAHGESPDNLE